MKIGSGKEVCPVVSNLTLTVGQERESRRGAEAGVGVCVFVRLRMWGRQEGVTAKKTLRGVKGGQKDPFERRKT